MTRMIQKSKKGIVRLAVIFLTAVLIVAGGIFSFSMIISTTAAPLNCRYTACVDGCMCRDGGECICGMQNETPYTLDEEGLAPDDVIEALQQGESLPEDGYVSIVPFNEVTVSTWVDFQTNFNSVPDGGTLIINLAADIDIPLGTYRLYVLEGRDITIRSAPGPRREIQVPITQAFPSSGNWLTGSIPVNGSFAVEGTLRLENVLIRGSRHGAIANTGTGSFHVRGANARLYMEDGAVITAARTETQNAIPHRPGGAVTLDYGATLTMNGGEIYDNLAGSGGAVAVLGADTTFIMNDGVIRENITSSQISNRVGGGGGVIVANGGSFTMNDGLITENIVSDVTESTFSAGGGVDVVGAGSEFIMNGGEISGHEGVRYGGGVNVRNGARFEMHNDALVTRNNAINGGGVRLHNARLYMHDQAKISGNRVGLTEDGVPVIDTLVGSDSTNGGGIHATSSNIEMHDDAVVSNNETYFRWYNNSRTGVIPVVPPAPQPLPGAPNVANIFDNANGGGIWMTGGRLDMHDSSSIRENNTYAHFENNVPGTAIAPQRFANGGGIFMQGGARLDILSADVEIVQNRTNSNADEFNPTVAGGFTREQVVHTRRLINPITVGSGGGIYVVGTNSVVNMDHGRINRNVATTQGGTAGGAGVFVGITASPGNGGPAEFNMRNGTIGGSSAAYANMFLGGSGATGAGAMVIGQGTIFYQYAPARITFNNTNNTSTGGGMHVSINAIATLHGQVSNNAAGNSGGGISIAGATVNMRSGSVVEHNLINTAGQGGVGVVIAGGGILHMDGGSEIRYNRNSRSGNNNTFSPGAVVPPTGGGIRINNGHVHMNSGSVIRDNAANNSGGGIFMENANSRVFMNGGTITNNRAAITTAANHGGGGVFMSAGRFYQTSGAITDNYIGTVAGVSANNSGGGGVRITGGTFTMDGGSISNHDFTNMDNVRGGGVHMTGGEFNINNDAEVYGNTAWNNGGGFYISGAQLTMNAGIIRNNNANSGGGVHLNNAIFNLNNGTIHSNGANSGPSSNMRHGGGGVAALNQSQFTQRGGVIRNNTSNLYGGGVYLHSSTFDMYGGIIGGGRSYFSGTGATAIQNISPQANRATIGGGVHVTGNSTFEMKRCPNTDTYGSVLGNNLIPIPGLTPQYAAFGGGVAVSTRLTTGSTNSGSETIDTYNSATFIMHYGDVSGNLAFGGRPTTGMPVNPPARGIGGGGVGVAYDGAEFIMNNGVISDNGSTSWSGGGVAVVANAEFEMRGGAIEENSQRGAGGGGVAVRNSGKFTLIDGTIQRNNATIGAGVLCYNEGEFLMEGGFIRENIIHGGPAGTALNGGGGVAVMARSEAVMTGGEITHHSVPGSRFGGGVWVGEFDSPPAAHLRGSSTFTMYGGLIAHNEANIGGGVHVRGGMGHCWQCDVSFNAQGVCPNGHPTNAVRNSFSTFNMHGGLIENNTAITNGGGVHVNDRGIMHMDGGTIGHDNSALANTALSGGGIWLGNGANLTMEEGVSGLSGQLSRSVSRGSIIGNIATGTIGYEMGGGGVFMTGANTKFDLNAGVIRSNTAPATGNGSGGGVWAGLNSELNMNGGTIGGDLPEHGNSARFGGGVHVRGGAKFNMQGDSVISRNTAFEGGGIWSQGIDPVGGVFPLPQDNTNVTVASGVISHNTTTAGGAGWYHSHGAIATIGTQGSTNHNAILIHDNIAAGNGGGITTTGSAMTMHNGTIFGNSAVNGGAVRAAFGQLLNGLGHGGTEFTLNNGIIRNNQASQSGGGFSLASGVTGESGEVDLIMNGGEIRNNTAGANGGGVALAPTGNAIVRFNMNDGTIGGNAATDANSAINGGGVWIGNGATVDMSSGLISRNSATYGGGVYVSELGFIASTGSFTNNSATQDGGAIFTEDYSYENPADTAHYNNMALVGATLSGNTAGSHHAPPNNAADFNSRFQGSLLNNFNINYRRPEVPPTGLDLESESDIVLLASLVVLPLAIFVVAKTVRRKRKTS